MARGKRGPYWVWDGYNWTRKSPPRKGCFTKTTAFIIFTTISMTLISINLIHWVG